jgi:cellulose biosynthesis protein BcsQ
MKTYALYHLKGGVGKTTTCVHLAHLAAAENYKTLVWDLDTQGSATYILNHDAGIEGGIKQLLKLESSWKEIIKTTAIPNLYLLPSDPKNRNLDVILNDLKHSKKRFDWVLDELKAHFDYVFLDCPPNLNVVAENVFQAVDFVLIPMIPTALSKHSFEQVRYFFEQEEYDSRKLIPFFTLVDNRKNIHLDSIKAFQTSGQRMIHTTIPYSSLLEKISNERTTIFQLSPKSKPAACYRNVWQELKCFRKLKPINS